MSEQTTADDHVDTFREAIETSFSEISRLLDRSMWGAESYNPRMVLNTINIIQDIKDEWGIEG